MNKQAGTVLFNANNWLIPLAILGITVAAVVPLIINYQLGKDVDKIVDSANQIKQLVSKYSIEHNKWPSTFEVMNEKVKIALPLQSQFSIKEGVVFINVDNPPQLQGEIVLTPMRFGNNITWTCDDTSLAEEYRSDNC